MCVCVRVFACSRSNLRCTSLRTRHHRYGPISPPPGSRFEQGCAGGGKGKGGGGGGKSKKGGGAKRGAEEERKSPFPMNMPVSGPGPPVLSWVLDQGDVCGRRVGYSCFVTIEYIVSALIPDTEFAKGANDTVESVSELMDSWERFMKQKPCIDRGGQNGQKEKAGRAGKKGGASSSAPSSSPSEENWRGRRVVLDDTRSRSMPYVLWQFSYNERDDDDDYDV